MQQFIKHIYLLLTAGCLWLLHACDKKDSFNTAELHVYAASGTLAYNVIQGDFKQIGNTLIASPGTSFPVLLSRSVDRDIQVNITIDTSLTGVYDSIYKRTTPSAKIPDGAFALRQNGLLTIPAGQTTTSADAQVEIKNASLLKEGTDYIIPILISGANNGVPVSASRNIIFLKTQLKVIKAGISTFSNTNTINITLTRENNTITGLNKLYLKGVLNEPLAGNTQITAEAAPDLVTAYNQQTGKNYVSMPASSYELQKPAVTIPENTTNSADSIAISLPNLQLFQMGNDYLLPIQIKTVTNQFADLPADETKKVVYVQVSIVDNNVDATNTGLNGTTIPRTGWIATASSTLSNILYGPARSIDGNTGTAWLASGLPQWLQVNMTAVKTVKGFNINSVIIGGSRYGDILEMEVLSSNDGSTWKLEGSFKSPASATKVVKFVTPVSAQYFRFNITKTADNNYSGMGELNAVE